MFLGVCRIQTCGCPDNFLNEWCTDENSKSTDSFCAANQENCNNCDGGIWCSTSSTSSPTSSGSSFGNNKISYF